MTAIMTTRTKRQAALFGEFMLAFDNLKQGIERVALKYKECKDQGIDMSAAALEGHGVPASLTLRLEMVAEGKLLPDLGYRLLSAPDKIVKVISTLPPDKQKKLAKEGVHVWRDNAEIVVPLEKVLAPEARRLIDPNSGRLLTPEEQSIRAMPPPKRKDQEIRFLVTSDQYNDIARSAKRAGLSVATFILTELCKTGVVKGARKRSAA